MSKRYTVAAVRERLADALDEAESGIPVPMPGATVSEVEVTPGDLVLADSDGAIAVPAAVAEQVLERAEELQNREVQIRTELAGGLSLSDALAKFGHV